MREELPKYSDIGEAEVVDLAPDGLPFVPALGEAHYTKVGPRGCDLHVHPGIVEILLCRRGRGVTIDCGHSVYPFPAGTVMVMQPEVPHVLRPYPKNLSTSWVWFRLPRRGETLPGFSAAETRWLVARLRALPATFPATNDMVQSFRRIWRLWREVPRKARERRLVMREALMRLLMDVFEASAKDHRETDDERLAALIAEMRRDCARDWTLDELATRAAMSVPVLTESTRRLTGLPPHQFLISCRMEKAKELLARTDHSVEFIAGELNIATAQHFATLFKRETGFTPSAWRRAHLRGRLAPVALDEAEVALVEAPRRHVASQPRQTLPWQTPPMALSNSPATHLFRKAPTASMFTSRSPRPPRRRQP